MMMIICEWEFLLKPTFPRLFTSLPSWAELGRFWTSLARLDQQTPRRAPISLELLMGPQTLSRSHNRMIDWELDWINYRGEPEHDSQTDMTFTHCGVLLWFQMQHRISARVRNQDHCIDLICFKRHIDLLWTRDVNDQLTSRLNVASRHHYFINSHIDIFCAEMSRLSSQMLLYLTLVTNVNVN